MRRPPQLGRRAARGPRLPHAAGLLQVGAALLARALDLAPHLEPDPVAGLGRQRAAYAVGPGGRLDDRLAQHEVGEEPALDRAPARLRRPGPGDGASSTMIASRPAAPGPRRRRGDRSSSSMLARAGRRPRRASTASSPTRASARTRSSASAGDQGQRASAPSTEPGAARSRLVHSAEPYLATDEPPDPLPALLDRRLGAQRGRLVVLRVGDHVGGVLLLGDAERLVVAVRVRRAVAELLRAGVVGVAQVRRHLADLAGAYVGARGVDGRDHGVGLRRDRQRDRGLGEVEPGLGHADQLHGLGGGDGGGERRRVGQPDVLAGQDHQPPGDEARVLPRLDHPGQVVQRGVGVGAADRLDEGAGHVVVLVALPVVAHGGLVDGGLGGLQVDHGSRRARSRRRARHRRPPRGRSATAARRRRRAGPGGRARRRRARPHPRGPRSSVRAAARRRSGRRRRSATRAAAAGCARAAARSPRRTGSRWSPRPA